MPTDYTTDTLLTSIKTRVMFPTKQNTFTDALILQLANEELQTVILPMIMSLQWEFFVDYIDYDLTSAREYNIPPNAIGSKLRDVVVINSSGQENTIPLISQDMRGEASTFPFGVEGFYIRGGKVILSPNITQGITLRLYYFRRPNRMVSTGEAGQIVSFSSVTNTTILSNVPVDWTTDDTICVVSSTPDFPLTVSGSSVTDVSSPTLTLPAATISSLVEGDWLCLEGETAIPQIPVEAHPVLAQAVAVKIIEAFGDQQQVGVSQEKFNQIMDNYRKMVAPRVEGEPHRVVTRRGIADYVGRQRWRGRF